MNPQPQVWLRKPLITRYERPSTADRMFHFGKLIRKNYGKGKTKESWTRSTTNVRRNIKMTRILRYLAKAIVCTCNTHEFICTKIVLGKMPGPVGTSNFKITDASTPTTLKAIKLGHIAQGPQVWGSEVTNFSSVTGSFRDIFQARLRNLQNN